MKYLFKILVFACVFSCGSQYVFAAPLDVVLSVVTPINPNELVHRNTPLVINWLSGGVTLEDLVTIAVKDSVGDVHVLAYDVPNTGAYQWLVPDNFPGGPFKFTISTIVNGEFVEANGPNYIFLSSFTQEIPQLSVTTPNDKEVLVSGEDLTIFWEPSDSTAETVTISLIDAVAGVGDIIFQETPNDGQQRWSVAPLREVKNRRTGYLFLKSDTYKIQIECVDGSCAGGMSDEAFTIAETNVEARSSVQNDIEKEESLPVEETQNMEEEPAMDGSNSNESRPPSELVLENLGPGSSGDSVTTLQKLLSQDTKIYPEALVTGYYGTLTQKAVERFQCTHNVVCSGTVSSSGYGFVGPRTREVISSVFQSGGEVVAPTGSQTETNVQDLQAQIQQLLDLIGTLQKQILEAA